MFYLNPQSAFNAVSGSRKAGARTAAFIALGADALTAQGIQSLCADEFAAWHSEQDDKTKKKLDAAIIEAVLHSEYFCACPFNSGIEALRNLSPLLHALLSDDPEAPADSVKRAYRALFRGDAPLILEKRDFQLFMDFVADVLWASLQKDVLLGARSLARAPAIWDLELVDSLRQVLGALNTHDAKSAHSAAKFQAFFPESGQASRYLSAEAFPSYISGRSGGGALQHCSWLSVVLPFQVGLVGEHPRAIYTYLQSREARDVLQKAGVGSWDAIPLLEPPRPQFDPKHLARVRIKVADDLSVALNLMPANSMLLASTQLAERILDRAALRRALVVREAALEGLPAAMAADPRFSVAEFKALFERYGAAKREPMLKAVSAKRKEAGLAELPSSVFYTGLDKSKRDSVPAVLVAGDKTQNGGGAYQAAAGTAGIYRFPAAVFQGVGDTLALRRFYRRLPARFSASLKRLQAKLAEGQNPMAAYKVGLKWLPARMQKRAQESRVGAAAGDYVSMLQRLRREHHLTEQEQAQLVPAKLSELQRFAAGLATEPDYRALAGQGLQVLPTSDRQAAEQFIQSVCLALSEGESA